MVDQAEKLRALVAAKTNYVKDSKSHKVRILTVTSGKGGVGKSNMTVNLALALTQMGKKVVIFDADFGLANVDILLGLMPLFNMHHVVRGEKQLWEIILEGPNGIRIVPGSSGLLDMANLNNQQRQKLLKQLLLLEKETDIILIDTGAGISKSVVGFISAANDILLVTNPEPTALTDAYGVAKIISNYQLHQEVKLVVNQVKNAQEGIEVAERFLKVSQEYLSLRVDYLGCIVHDSVVTRSVREQKPFLLSYPHSKATLCINQLAENLLSPHLSQEPIGGGISSFFTKIAKIFT